jgi:Competence protein A./Fimbrial assembly protein (PilN).
MFKVDLKKLNPFSHISVKEAVGIDFSENYIKIARVKIHPNNNRELVSVSSQNITASSDDDISNFIRGTFARLNARSPDIIFIIPSNLVITKNIEIPSVDPVEIKEIISLQAGRHTPHSLDEIIIDHIDIGVFKRSYTKSLLIIVSNAVMRRYVGILSKAGVRTEKALFAPEGMALSILKMLRMDGSQPPLNIININETNTDFSVIFKNKVLFARSIPIGATALITEKERYEARFTEEVKNSVEAYQSEDIEKNPSLAILTGSIEGITGLDAALGSVLPFPVKTMPYDRNSAALNSAAAENPSLKHLSFLNIIAALFAYDRMKVNLIPQEIRLRKSFEERGKALIKSGVFALSLLVLVFLTFITKIYFKADYLDRLDRKYMKINTEAKKLEGDFTKIGLIKNYLLKRGYPLDILTELYTLIPAEIEISDIRYEDSGKFTIRGTAESMSSVFSFVDAMEKSDFFKDVKTKYTTKRKSGTKDVTDFEIACSTEKGHGD